MSSPSSDEEEEVIAVFSKAPPEKEPECDVVIEVKNPETTKSLIGKHIEYTVAGQDQNGFFEVRRRYKEFLSLRNRLVVAWPGCWIPQVPPKVAIGNKTEAFVNTRRKKLEEFLRKSSMISFLYHSDDYQQFIRQTSSYLKLPLGQSTYKSIYVAYDAQFAQFVQGYENRFLDEIGNDLELFKGLHDFIERLSFKFDEMRRSYENMTEGYSKIGNYMASYENAFQQEPSESPTYKFKIPVFGDNPYEILANWSKTEILDVRSMIEAISKIGEYQINKEKTEKKLRKHNLTLEQMKAGKSSLAGIFSGKSKDKRIVIREEKIKGYSEDLECIQSIYRTMVVRLYKFEIPHFKRVKIEKYRLLMKSFNCQIQ